MASKKKLKRQIKKHDAAVELFGQQLAHHRKNLELFFERDDCTEEQKRWLTSHFWPLAIVDRILKETYLPLIREQLNGANHFVSIPVHTRDRTRLASIWSPATGERRSDLDALP